MFFPRLTFTVSALSSYGSIAIGCLSGSFPLPLTTHLSILSLHFLYPVEVSYPVSRLNYLMILLASIITGVFGMMMSAFSSNIKTKVSVNMIPTGTNSDDEDKAGNSEFKKLTMRPYYYAK